MIFSEKPAHRWLYPCELVRIIDADTIVLMLDRGFHDYAERTVRLLGVNAPELRGVSAVAGRAARDFVVHWLSESGGLLLESNKYEKYGRTLGTLWRADGRCLNQDLLDAGHAVAMED